MKRLITLALVVLFSVLVQAESIDLKKDYPERYVVVKGDTLWDLAGKFLRKPWQWSQIWNKNPQVKNPHLIYPGDVLRLRFVDGQPVLVVNDGRQQNSSDSREIFSEAPDVRNRLPGTEVPMVSLDKVESFLNSNRIIRAVTRKKAPYILGVEDERILAGKGDRIYARGDFAGNRAYAVYRQGRELKDAQTGQIIGEEALHIADVRVLAQRGEITELMVESSSQEVHKMDFLLPRRQEPNFSAYYPSLPDRFVKGQIIFIHNNATRAGRWDVALLDLGFNDGLRPGNVLAVYKAAEQIYDPVRKELVAMPAERSGEVVVFRVYEDLSYALVAYSANTLQAKDQVTNP